MPDSILLTVQDLRVHFKQGDHTVFAVNGLSLEVGDREVVALVGASGSGKSITALSIMRLLPESAVVVSGRIIFEGVDLLSLSRSAMRRIQGVRISMIFQDPRQSLNPVFSIGYQLEEVLRAHTRQSGRAIRTQVVAMLQEVGLSDTEKIYHDYPHQLSGGMCQRVMIAQALLAGARLLIADEPTSNLDVTLQAQILNLLREIRKKRSLSVLLISHDLALVSHIADRITVIEQGVPVESGLTEQIFNRPAHRYTKELLAAVRIS